MHSASSNTSCGLGTLSNRGKICNSRATEEVLAVIERNSGGADERCVSCGSEMSNGPKPSLEVGLCVWLLLLEPGTRSHIGVRFVVGMVGRIMDGYVSISSPRDVRLKGASRKVTASESASIDCT